MLKITLYHQKFKYFHDNPKQFPLLFVTKMSSNMKTPRKSKEQKQKEATHNHYY